MARILGVDIPNDKQVQYSLTYIYGVGLKTAQKACADAGVEPTIRVKNLTEEQITAHRRGLPCRGQGTKNNARTCKGPRKTIANKKVASK